jgi:hypothetical protein
VRTALSARSVRAIPLLLALACDGPAQVAVSCGGDAPAAVSALNGGTSEARFLGMDERQALAVVQVATLDPGGNELALCSGTSIAPSWVLTARHCLPEGATPEIRAVDAHGTIVDRSTVDRVVAHHEEDLALLALVGTGMALPVVSAAAELPADFEDGLVQLAGTGISEIGGPGPRQFSVATVVEVGPSSFRVTADGFAGACVGDSGGPALIRTAQGTLAVAGVLSGGSVTCWGVDEYVRLDAVRAWLADSLGAAPAAADTACGTLDQAGACFGDTAAWCAGGSVRGQRCSGGLSCGWDRASNGYRCIRPEEDPCAGVDGFGACLDGDAVSCVDGVRTRNACGACGATCVRSPRTGEVTCAVTAV